MKVQRSSLNFNQHRTMSQTIQILNGPSREELFDGLRLFAEKREVGFNLESNGREITLPFIMQSIEPEDGSGNSWNTKMNLHVDSLGKDFYQIPLEIRKAFLGTPTKKVIQVKTYYSTKTRKGVITLE
ncbi:MAG: hypothetical protein NTX85_02280 [Candidatus Nomurabacteria bacterium]|nr:hypothetical protein [Candidatus Nomurabacteria bacterium]